MGTAIVANEKQRSLKGKRIVLTGASRGIGRSCALRLVQAGANVLAIAREIDALVALKGETRNFNGRLFPHSCDISDVNGISAINDAAIARLGGVDALVNNAGVAIFHEITELTPEQFDKTLAVCLKGPFLLIKALLQQLEQSQGDIINVSSIAAVDGFPGASAYCAAKAGLEGMTRALVSELRPKGIRLVILRPGATATQLWEGIPGQFDSQKMVPPEVVAESVEFLLRQSRQAWTESLSLYPPDGKV